MPSDAEDGHSPGPDVKDDFDSDQEDVTQGDDSMAEAGVKDASRQTESNASSDPNTPNAQAKPNPKDPMRPRRKKARRACFACQRAHLTCGDERPCQRCIKRGLQDACQDGIRKKAKYLHDAPPEALIPPQMGGTYTLHGTQASDNPQQNEQLTRTPVAQPNLYYSPAQPMNVDIYGHSNQQTVHTPLPNGGSFGPHTPISPHFNHSAPQQPGNMAAPQQPMHQNPNAQAYPFDPSDPALFNFDISNLNFGNQYGALEFGMLGHMASTANDVHGNGEVMTPMGQHPPQFTQNHNMQDHQSILFGQDAMMNVDWHSQRNPAPPSNGPLETPHNTPIIQSVDRPEVQNGPYAYAIGARPNSLASASPVSLTQDTPAESSGSPNLFTPGTTASPYNRPMPPPVQQHPSKSAHSESLAHTTTAAALNPGRKRPHDADYIYDTVEQPYPYTAGFHRLLHYIKTHFSKDKVYRIAQALAAIRPSLITYAQQLTDKDLIFMEISVQRKLYAYDEFIKAYGTPTVIARRDGAIVAVSQEFVILTGWSKNVLVGKEPNHNTNTGGGGSAAGTATNSGRGTRRTSAEPESSNAGTSTSNVSATNGTASKPSAAPSSPPVSASTSTSALTGAHHVKAHGTAPVPKNVLIAEIMHQDSVAEFYEDYAKLAFSDPMGRALRRGKLLKYRTGTGGSQNGAAAHKRERSRSDATRAENGANGANGANGKEGIAGEGAFVKLGEKEGVVDCMYCWNVRRDNFEVPQLIVMNFLPVISATNT